LKRTGRGAIRASAVILGFAAASSIFTLLGQTPTFTEYAVPTAKSQPFAITAGPDGALWFTENIGTKIGRISTSGVITQ
jgi:streptogramin lyase